ncbi:MAG: hypothetical protein ACO1OB_15835 [Archangium sp.]
MDPLSKDADEALKSLLDVEPSRDDEARVRAQLEKSLGIVLPAAAAATTVAGAVATVKSGVFASMSLGAKVTVLTVAVVGAGAVTTFALRSRTEQPPPMVPVVTVKPSAPRPPMVLPELELQPEDEAPPQPEFELVLLAPPEPPPRAKPVVTPPPLKPQEVSTPPAPQEEEPEDEDLDLHAVPLESVDAELAREYPACDLATEQRLAAHVRWMPKTGIAERGLELLSTWQHRCATGHWTYDSWVARFAVLCSLERKQEVNELWAWFSQENERHVTRMRRDLDGVCAF